jgi:hypothetical protein
MLNLQLLIESKQIINNNLVLKCSQNIESPERTQIKFDADKRSEKKVSEYVNDLLSYHKIPKEKRSEKKDELMDKIK